MIVQSVLKNMFPSAFQADARDLTPRDMVVRKASAHKGFKFGLTLLVIIALMGIFGPMLLGTSPFEQDLTQRLLPPVWVSGGSWEHLLGTDGNGRDYQVRILYGTRISLTIGIGAACVGMLIGVSLGVIAGFHGGWIDQVVNYILTCLGQQEHHVPS